MTLAQAQEASSITSAASCSCGRASASSTSAPAGRAAAVGGAPLRRRRDRQSRLSRNQHEYVQGLIDAEAWRPGADAAARLPRPARGPAVRRHRLGRHVRACRPGAAAAYFAKLRRLRCGRPGHEPRHHPPPACAPTSSAPASATSSSAYIFPGGSSST
jgi:hypothetical protein